MGWHKWFDATLWMSKHEGGCYGQMCWRCKERRVVVRPPMRIPVPWDECWKKARDWSVR
jgi:hypothetical protein